MLFNSFHFVLFFPLFIVLYFKIAHKHRWKLLLASGYYFYFWHSPKFFYFLFISTVVDYFSAIWMDKQTEKRKRKFWLIVSLCCNLGILFVFKYAAFVNENIRIVLSWLHINYPIQDSLFSKLIMPVGISFYTFQSISYTFDVYKGIVKPEKHFGYFASFVAFWPTLINGPIERANRLLPQIKATINFNYERARLGFIRILWGMFKKIVIADRLAIYADNMYFHFNEVSGWTIILGGFAFFLQVYCDFSGYSDIAIGCAKVLGIDVMENFKRPMFSKSLPDFWTRWHISLSTWLTDYIFYFLGAYKASTQKVIFNVIFVLTLCGIWHGANYPMILSFLGIGLLMSLRFLWIKNVIRHIQPSNLYKLYKKYFPEWMHVVVTLFIIIFCFLLFRTHVMTTVYNNRVIGLPLDVSLPAPVAYLVKQDLPNLQDKHPIHWYDMGAALYKKMFYLNECNYLNEWLFAFGKLNLFIMLFYLSFLLCFEYIYGERKIEDIISMKSKKIRWSFYIFILLSIVWLGEYGSNTFVYFQF